MKIDNILNKYRKVPVGAKAAFWFVVCSTLQKCIAMITTPIFTRLLTEDQYGLFSVYNSWLSVFSLFSTFCLEYAVFNKGMCKYSDDRDGYTSVMQSITTIITTALLILYLIFKDIINEFTGLTTFIILIMFLEIYFKPAISFWLLRQRYEYRYKSVVFISLLISILNTIVGVIAVLLSNEKGVARIISTVLVQVCIGAAIYMINLRRGKKIFDIEYSKFAILFNIPLIPHYISTYILEHCDRIMIQKLSGMVDTGLYSVAQSIGYTIKIVTGGVNQAITPWLYEKLEEKKYDEISKNFQLIMLILMLPIAVFIAVAPEALKLLASKSYWEGVYVIPPLATSAFFTFIYGTFSNVEFFFGKNKFTMVVSLIGALLNIILNYVFIGMFGYVAAGYTTLFCYFVFAIGHGIYSNYVSKKMVGVKIFDMSKILFLSLLIVLVSVGMSLSYHLVLLRWSIIVGIVLVAFIKKKYIISFFSDMKRN